MAMPANIKRFRVNPVEIVIFLGVLGVFSNSIYRLFEDRENLKAAQRQFTETISQSADRAPASVLTQATNTFASLEMPCALGNAHLDTQAQKIRLGGKLCGAEVSENGTVSVHKSQIVNTANHYNATVFADAHTARFTTDYIPLDPGKNTFQVDFGYAGHQYHQELVINQNRSSAEAPQE